MALIGRKLLSGGRFFTDLKAAALESELVEFVLDRFLFTLLIDFDDLLLCGEICLPEGCIDVFREVTLLSERLLVFRRVLSDCVLYSKLGPFYVRLFF